ncbi:MarR family winged helix-turn-helix transcriptional regulator [Micromonospora matsumotoense]|uniref:MarR family winged helix-turn-helix transcriptional regulator n=1 Tax=Micromonospora matsumotoense TaxID=121616 RepID=UPI003409AC4C
MTQGAGPTEADRADRAGLTGETVRRFLHVAGAIRQDQEAALAALGLTPAVARALYELDPDRPSPARDLAARLACDRSNVTSLVDRLEQAGLVTRRVDPIDRRQKALLVTDEGRRVREQVREALSGARLLVGLTIEELSTLRELVGKVSDGGWPQRCAED